MSEKFVFDHVYRIENLTFGLTTSVIRKYDNSFSSFLNLFDDKSIRLIFIIKIRDEKTIIDVLINGHYFYTNLADIDEIESITLTNERTDNRDLHRDILYNSCTIIPNKLNIEYINDGKSEKTFTNKDYSNYMCPILKIDELSSKIVEVFDIKNKEWDKEKIKELDERYKEELEYIKDAVSDNEEGEEYMVGKLNSEGTSMLSYDSFSPLETTNRQKIVSYIFHCKPVDDITLLKQTKFLKINNSISGEVEKYEDTDDYLEITLSFEEIDVDLIPKSGKLEYAYSAFQNNIRKKAIYKLKSNPYSPLNNSYLKFKEENDAFYKDDKLIEEIIENHKYRPNEKQEKAIRKGAALNNSGLLVLGPPGTGKTTVIVDWIKYYVSKGKKVLITSMSNMAVDNALKGSIKKENEDIVGRPISCVRVGSIEKIKNEEMKKLTLDCYRDDFQDQIFYNSKENVKNITKSIEALKNGIKTVEYFDKEFNSFKVKLDNKKIELQKKLDSINKLNKSISDYLYEKECIEKYLSSENLFFKIFLFFKNIKKKLRIKKLTKLIINNKAKLESELNEYESNLEDLNKDMIRIPGIFDYNSVKSDLFLDEFKKYFKKTTDYIVDKAKMLVELNLGLKNLDILKFIFHSSKDLVQRFSSEIEKETSLKRVLDEYNDFLNGRNIEDFNKESLEHVDVVGATCIGIQSNKAFKQLEFDVVIVDEAGQILPYDILVPLSMAKENYIMVGDYQQIPPVESSYLDIIREKDVVVDDSEKKYLDTSYFEMLYKYFDKKSLSEKKLHVVNLDTQYRMPSSISDLLSEAFYNGEYHAFEDKKKEEPLFGFPSNFVLYDVKKYEEKSDTGYINQEEVNVIKEIINHIKSKDDDYRATHDGKSFFDDQDNLGIIAPYKSQVNYLTKELNKILDGKASRFVNTLDSFQGQERDMIIFSFVRSNDSSLNENINNKIGFLKETRRINVALSRCKKQLICVGNFEFLSKVKENKDKEIEKFNKFLNMAVEKGRQNNNNKYDVMFVDYVAGGLNVR